jgi:hypothetical protein
MGDCNSTQTPMEERLKLSHHSEAEEEDVTFYHKLVGTLRYLVHTRPDLVYAIGYLNRFIQRPTAEHMAALKRVPHYVAGTINNGCFYKRSSGGARLIGYSNNDYIRAPPTCSSLAPVWRAGAPSSKELLQSRRVRQSMSPRLLQQHNASGWHVFIISYLTTKTHYKSRKD